MSKIGIIGGSGLYQIEGIEGAKWQKVNTPFGEPSDEYLTGRLRNREVVFLPRHGRGHKILPTELNYRANIYGMKSLGVETIISVSAVGSLKEDIKPLDILIPDQFVDRTNQARKTSFFGEGIAAHVSLAEPVCPVMSKLVYETAKKAGACVHEKGTYLNMEGPAFSTKAESNLFRKWDMDIIGMTNMPEARLAREAEICFVTMAMITDYDCWRESEDVDIQMIIENLNKNVDLSKKIIKAIVDLVPIERNCSCSSALKYAIITDRKVISTSVKKKLSLLIGKYIN